MKLDGHTFFNINSLHSEAVNVYLEYHDNKSNSTFSLGLLKYMFKYFCAYEHEYVLNAL